jgi:hypothetical protein
MIAGNKSIENCKLQQHQHVSQSASKYAIVCTSQHNLLRGTNMHGCHWRGMLVQDWCHHKVQLVTIGWTAGAATYMKHIGEQDGTGAFCTEASWQLLPLLNDE